MIYSQYTGYTIRGLHSLNATEKKSQAQDIKLEAKIEQPENAEGDAPAHKKRGRPPKERATK